MDGEKKKGGGENGIGREIREYLHAIAQAHLTRRAHFGLCRIEFRVRGDTDLLVHVADALDVIKVAAVEALVDFFVDDVELAARLDVFTDVDGRRPWHNMRYFFEAVWVQHVHVEDAGCGVVPGRGWIRVFVYVLDCTIC